MRLAVRVPVQPFFSLLFSLLFFLNTYLVHYTSTFTFFSFVLVSRGRHEPTLFLESVASIKSYQGPTIWGSLTNTTLRPKQNISRSLWSPFFLCNFHAVCSTSRWGRDKMFTNPCSMEKLLSYRPPEFESIWTVLRVPSPGESLLLFSPSRCDEDVPGGQHDAVKREVGCAATCVAV